MARAKPNLRLPDAESVARESAKQAARKSASKARIRKPAPAQPDPASTQAAVTAPAPVVDHTAEYAANARQALWVDYCALHGNAGLTSGGNEEFHAYLDDQGFNPDGTPKPEKHTYTGPMVALKSARLHYVKGANGNPHCGDAIARRFASMKPAEVIADCMKLLKLMVNPYAHLNIGQQSMNLRNKLRQAIKSGFVTLGTEADEE